LLGFVSDYDISSANGQ